MVADPGWPRSRRTRKIKCCYMRKDQTRGHNPAYAKVAAYDATSSVTADQKAWRGTTLLSDEGLIGHGHDNNGQRFASDQDFARFLMARFQRDFTYSTTTSYDAGSSTVALDQFFFEGLSVHCSFFAQSAWRQHYARWVSQHRW